MFYSLLNASDYDFGMRKLSTFRQPAHFSMCNRAGAGAALHLCCRPPLHSFSFASLCQPRSIIASLTAHSVMVHGVLTPCFA
eukprot:5520449-Amphidinium_carterae.1